MNQYGNHQLVCISLRLSRRLTDALFPSCILKAALLCHDERINIKLSARSDSKLLQKILTNSQGEDSFI